jgi:hypothetical protein
MRNRRFAEWSGVAAPSWRGVVDAPSASATACDYRRSKRHSQSALLLSQNPASGRESSGCTPSVRSSAARVPARSSCGLLPGLLNAHGLVTCEANYFGSGLHAILGWQPTLISKLGRAHVSLTGCAFLVRGSLLTGSVIDLAPRTCGAQGGFRNHYRLRNSSAQRSTAPPTTARPSLASVPTAPRSPVQMGKRGHRAPIPDGSGRR